MEINKSNRFSGQKKINNIIRCFWLV